LFIYYAINVNLNPRPAAELIKNLLCDSLIEILQPPDALDQNSNSKLNSNNVIK
jgi:hypothetical protein